MNRWIKYMLVSLSVFSIIILFYKQNYILRTEQLNYEKTLDNSYQIIITTPYGNQEESYTEITRILDRYNANLYYDYSFTNKLNKKAYRKYVYLNNDVYLEGIPLKSGRMPIRDEIKGQWIISTKESSEQNQLGIVLDFGENDLFEIKSFSYMLQDKIAIRGKFTVQVKETDDIEKLIQEMNEGLTTKVYKQELYPEIISFPPYEASILLVYISISIMLFYDLLKRYKNIGIQKMLGHSGVGIWLNYLRKIVGGQALTQLVVYIIGLIILCKGINQYTIVFTKRLIEVGLMLILINIFFVSVPFLYIKKIKIVHGIKNKLPRKKIFILNIFLKTLFLSLFFIIVGNGLNQYDIISRQYNEKYINWNITKDYAVIPTISNITNEEISSKEFREKQKELFCYFNKKGSIYADFNDLLPVPKERQTRTEPYQFFAEVNPNYLIIHDVYDEQGKKVKIDETEQSFILLVPTKYIPYEQEIIKYYKFIQTGYINEELVKNQTLKIVWTKSEQTVFSYLLTLNPKQNNTVSDPIIRVITEKNGDLTNYDKILGYYNNPYMIKVDSGDTPYETIYKKLEEVGLDKNVNKIYRVFDQVAGEVQSAKDRTVFEGIGLITLLIFIGIIVYQNVYLYVEMNMKILSIRYMLGYMYWDKYKEYFIYQGMSWLVILFILILSHSIKVWGIIIGMIGLEVIITIFLSKRLEVQKIIGFLKGR